MTTKRTTKEIAEAVAKATKDIRRVLDAVPVMDGHKWFNRKKFKESGFDELVKRTCKKYDVPEKHIRQVAEW